MAMLGNVIELSVVVKDLEAAIERYTKLFGLEVHKRGESKEFGFLNAILPTDASKPVGKFLAKHGEGVYLVGFECGDIPGAVKGLREQGVKVDARRDDIAWLHPREAHGLFVELRKRERYD